MSPIQLRPFDAADCAKLLTQYKSGLIQKEYEIDINNSIISGLSSADILFLATYVPSTWQILAESQSTPPNILEILARYSHIRPYVAGNPNTPLSLLEILANDSNSSVRCFIAKNPRIPVNILEALANDSDWYVRRIVAENLKTPVNILEALANDSDSSVRCSVAENLKTPKNILTKLSSDSDYRVRELAQENPNCPQNSGCLTGLFVILGWSVVAFFLLKACS